MARIIAGKITGKIGDLIYSNKNGINYLKKAPEKSLKAPSEKQLIQWKKFAMLMHFLSPLKKLLNESYRGSAKRSGLNNAMKKNLLDSITGEYPCFSLDYSKVSLVPGRLWMPPVEMAYDTKTNELLLSYECQQNFNAYLDDELIALIYCPELPPYWYQINTGLQRFEQIGALKLPEEVIGQEIHIWLYFRGGLDQFSNSVYIGKVSTQKPNSNETN
ncbi:MAG: DUF6266 family protein [Daejeonella sp.]|uniref:DUF6266 family protein n=1 Tax=Daejeonella sp. TaxID=2805397 RepID=UPI003C742CE0